jgi:carboxylate-amine ligase
MQFGAFPRTNIPPFFNSFKSYDDLINRYKKLESIEKSRQIWWKLRPHMDYGTIEFRMLDAQRSLKNTEMFIALAQALVFQSYEDLQNNVLNEKYSEELLNDSLWKASRFNFDAKIENFEDNSVHTLKDAIDQMIEYCNDALHHFNTSHIVEIINNILEKGTEGDWQYSHFKNHGMESLKNYLIKNVDYNL